jgi:hypothetical protein
VSFLALGLSLSLLVYGAFMGLSCLAVLPWLRGAARLTHPALRARRFAMLRLLPSVVGAVVVSGLFLPAFFWHEPRHTEENVSVTLLVLAALSAAVVAAGFFKGTLSLLSTQRFVRRLGETAAPLEGLGGIGVPAFSVNAPFPLVSLVGLFHPRIFVARSVLDACDAKELSAVVAHEVGHLEHRDPWTRLLLRFCPDALALTPWSDRVERAWAEAAEQRADDSASRRVPSIDVASALVKVARLMGSTPPRELLFPALYRGEGVSHRVARLLEAESKDNHSAPRSAWLVPFALATVTILSAAAFGLLPRVHELVEALVKFLQ